MTIMKSLPSPSQSHFSLVPSAEIQRSTFDRTHGLKTTFNAGYLVPIFVDEALPGDTFNLSMTGFGRLSTPLKPIMDNLHADTHFFAVPLRLVWDNFQRFMGEQPDPGDSTDFLIPQMTSPAGGYASQSLSDYFGIPTGVAGLAHSSLFHRAYNLIWNEFYRDQNLQDRVAVPKGDGPDDPALFTLLRRGKRHDYFTSALPWPQKGPAVQLPIGATAPVTGTAALSPSFSLVSLGMGSTPTATQNVLAPHATAAAGSTWSDAYVQGGAGGSNFKISDATLTAAVVTGVADLSAATASTINSLRQAFAIQRLYERDARGGTRYTEILLAHFGVRSPDARLQRPEYLGGGHSFINVSPVAQTSSTDATTPQANLAAIGTMTASGHGFNKSFVEHSIVIGFISVRADLTYQQGLNKMFSRRTRQEFYWPALSHLGEQSILNKEIFAQGTADDELTFGYQERFAEYRYKPSMITGKFRSQDAQSLDVWHLGQEFATLPTLSDTFIVENPPVARVVAVPSEPHLLLDCHFKFMCTRPMPTYSVPGLIDHF